MRRKFTFRNGFTLVELMVVTAIIAILIAITLPTLKTTRDEAYNAICTSQLDQIFTASFSYGMAWESRLPYFESSRNRPYKDEWWVTQIAPGLQNQLETYRCPSDEQPNRTVWLTYLNDHGKRTNKVRMASFNPATWKATWASAFTLDLSYRGSCDTVETGRYVNGQYICPPAHGAAPIRAVARKFTDWADPSKVIMLVESKPLTGGINPDCFRYQDIEKFHAIARYPRAFPSHMRSPSVWGRWRRHNGTNNYLMLDGSIQRLRPEDAAELAKAWKTQLYF